MTNRVSAVLWRLGIFVLVCALGAFALFAVFAQLRFEREQTYTAVFTNVSGLESEDFVRIAGHAASPRALAPVRVPIVACS